MGKMIAKSKRWMHGRHQVVYSILRPLLGLYYRFAYNYRGERYIAEDRHQPYLILSNHNGSVDPILLAQSFRQPIYFVASDHIFRWGWTSKLIAYLVAPIPIVKAQLDLKAIRQMTQIRQEGGTIGLFPSGNGSFAGPEMPIFPATAKLARSLKMPVLLFRMDGGYLTQPRWGESTRKGILNGRVVRELSVAKIESMEPSALNQLIQQTLNADPYADFDSGVEIDPCSKQLYRGERLAEYLERVLFVCPQCNQLNTLRSKDDRLSCPCGFTVRYGEDGLFYQVESSPDQPHSKLPHVKAFDQFQKNFLASWLDQESIQSTHRLLPFFTDDAETLTIVQRASHTEQVQHGQLSLFLDRLSFRPIDGPSLEFPVEQISFITVHGPQTLQFQDARTSNVYEVHSERPRSAYKYWVLVELLKQKAIEAKVRT